MSDWQEGMTRGHGGKNVVHVVSTSPASIKKLYSRLTGKMPGAVDPLFTPGKPSVRKSHPKTPYPREPSPIEEEESEPEYSTK